MRVISATSEREADCDCGARLSYWPADVTYRAIPIPLGTVAAPVGVTIVGEWAPTRVVKCPCCGASVEVGT